MELAIALGLALAVSWLVARLTRPQQSRRDRIERILPMDTPDAELQRRQRAARGIQDDR